MRALVWTGPSAMEMQTVDDPAPEAGEALIRVAHSGICGSELGGYLGHNSLRIPPLIMGHEFSGVIAELGPGMTAATLAPGTRVTVNPLIAGDGERSAARANLSRTREILGIHRPGSFAEYVKAPAQSVHALPEGLSLEMAALTEPMACAIRAAKQSHAGPTESALVTGLGPIGLLTALVLRESGLRHIIATDLDSDRRAMGEAIGLTVIDPGSSNVLQTVMDTTDGRGVEVAIDAVGAGVTRRQCVEAVRWGGRVVLVGLHADASELPANYIIRSEISVQGSFAYTPQDFADALQWLAEGRAPVEPWIEHAPLDRGGACFERLLDKPGPVLKILLDS